MQMKIFLFCINRKDSEFYFFENFIHGIETIINF